MDKANGKVRQWALHPLFTHPMFSVKSSFEKEIFTNFSENFLFK